LIFPERFLALAMIYRMAESPEYIVDKKTAHSHRYNSVNGLSIVPIILQ